MGMSTDMAPHFLPMNQSGQQMTYVLDTGNLNLAQAVQLAVPASEILLIQDKNEAIGLCDSPVLVATDMASAENIGWLGNNVLVLMSQPQEFVMVEQEVVLDSAQTWQVEGGGTVCVASSRVSAKQGSEYEVPQEEEASATTVEDAKCWFRDSLITAAALSTLTTYVQSNGQAKVG